MGEFLRNPDKLTYAEWGHTLAFVFGNYGDQRIEKKLKSPFATNHFSEIQKKLALVRFIKYSAGSKKSKLDGSSPQSNSQKNQMKKTTQYFGNHIASALAAHRANRKNKKSIISSPLALTPAPEFEALESRVLLSGVGIGSGVNQKSVTFNDAAGDLVKVAIQSTSGATFNIDLGGATNNADISNIQINGNGSLSVVVTPVGSFTKPNITTTIYDPNATLNLGTGNVTLGSGNSSTGLQVQTLAYQLTPGYTQIGSITAASGVHQVGSISLTGATVGDINLAGVAAGNISLSTGLVGRVDATMALNAKYGGGGWSPNLSNINFYNLEAGSVGAIQISGATGGVNNFDGDITVSGSIGSITGTNSILDGQVIMTGATSSLGTVAVSGYGLGSSISTEGNLTFHNATGFSGILDVAGNLALGLQGTTHTSNTFDGTVQVGGALSGLSGANSPLHITNETVQGDFNAGSIPGGIYFTSATVNNSDFVSTGAIGAITIGASSLSVNNSTFEGASLATVTSNIGTLGLHDNFISHGGITAIKVTNGSLGSIAIDPSTDIVAAGAIGNINVQNGTIADNIQAGSIGNIAVNNGNLIGNITIDVPTGSDPSTGTVGNINVNGGTLGGNIIAPGAIGTIYDHGTLNGTSTGITAHIVGGSIGTITENNGTINGEIATSTGNIGAINVNFGQLSGVVSSAGKIGAINILGGDGSISNAQIIAYDTSATAIGSITVNNIAQAGGGAPLDAINGSTIYSAGGIGPITATSINGSAIIDSNITAVGGVGSVTATTYASSGPAISGLTLVASSISSIATTSNLGTAITDTVLTATGSGGIGNITATGLLGGIVNLDPSTINTFTSAGDIGTVTGTSTSTSVPEDGINGLSLQATGAIAGITGVTHSGNSAVNGAGLNNVTASASGLGVISGTGYGTGTSSGILDGSYTATGAAGITSISGTSTSPLGSGSGISGTSLSATLGSVGTITGNAAGSGNGLDSLLVTGQVGIGNVTGTSNTGIGINGGPNLNNYTATTGNIGNFLGTSNTQDGIFLVNISAISGSVGSITGTSNGSGSGMTNNGLDTVLVNAGNNIGAITGSSIVGNGITMGSYLANQGTITSITGNTVTGTSISGATFNTLGGTIGPISANATGQGGNAIAGSTFSAPSLSGLTIQMGNLAAGDAVSSSKFTATTGDIGNISITNDSTTQGGGIKDGTTFTANAGSIGDILVSTNNGSAISGSTFTAYTDIGKISATETQGGLANAVIAGSTFTASGGNILGITANSANVTQDAAISSTTFTANGTISEPGSIGAISTTGQIDSTTSITATGNITALSVLGGGGLQGAVAAGGAITGNVILTGTANSGLGSLINQYALTGSITATSIGNIAMVGNDIGQITATNGGIGSVTIHAITVGGVIDKSQIGSLSSNIEATALIPTLGTIGAVTIDGGITSAGSISASGALSSLTVNAGGDAGSVTVSSITGTSTNTGIVAISLSGSPAYPGATTTDALSSTISVDNGITGSVTLTGNDSGNIFANNGGISSGSTISINAIPGDPTEVGQLSGTISANSTTTPANGAIGDVTVAGGIITNNGTITTTGNLNSLTVNSGGDAGVVSVGGNITNGVTLTGTASSTTNSAGIAGFSSNITANGNIGNVVINGNDNGGVITSSTGNLSNITVKGIGTDIPQDGNMNNAVFNALGNTSSIGNITSTGTGNITSMGSVGQSVTIDAQTTIGNVTYGAVGSNSPTTLTSTLTLTGNANTIGNIGDGNAFPTDLDLIGAGNLKNVGSIRVTGNFSVDDLSNAINVGSINVGTMNAPGGIVEIGSINTPGTIGSITFSSDSSGNPLNQYQFTFANYTGSPNVYIGPNSSSQFFNVTPAGVTSNGGALFFQEL